eukprot:gene8130-9000_t
MYELSLQVSFGLLPHHIFIVKRFASTIAIEHKNSSAILAKLLGGYNKDIIPSNAGQPVDVYVQVYIIDMVSLKNIHMHYSTDMFFRQIWVDKRLAFDENNNQSKLILSGSSIGQIWTPDVYFPSEKEAFVHDVVTVNSGIKIYGDGFVFYSQRISLTSFCPMDLLLYPFDVQHCNFTMSSYAYNELHILFTFYRDVTAYIMEDYLPAILTVILSWLSFWIDYRSQPARVALGITTMLTMVTILSKSDKASDVLFRSVDLYMFVCNMYVFCAVIEYAMVGIMEERRIAGSVRNNKVGDENKDNNVELGIVNLNALDEVSRSNAGTQHQNSAGGEKDEMEFNKKRMNNLFNRGQKRNDDADDRNNNRETMLRIANIIARAKEKKKTEPHKLDKLCRIAFPSSFVTWEKDTLLVGYKAQSCLYPGLDKTSSSEDA